MKNLILLILIYFMSTQGFGQNQYPISTVFKGESVVILTKKQSEEINQYITSLENKVDILENERFNLIDAKKHLFCLDEVENLKCQNDSLRNLVVRQKVENDSLKNVSNAGLDTVINFKKRIYDLCTGENIPSGVIIYRKNMVDTNLYMIDLSQYNMQITSVYSHFPYDVREKIILLPVRKNRRWILDIPQPQNLGLHMWPFDGIGCENKKLGW